MTERLVHIEDEFRQDLPKEDPLGDVRTYPRGWRGWVPAALAKRIVSDGKGRDVTPENGDAAADDKSEAKKAVTAAKRAVTVAEKKRDTIVAEIGDGNPSLDQAAARDAAAEAVTVATDNLAEAEKALSDLDG